MNGKIAAVVIVCMMAALCLFPCIGAGDSAAADKPALQQRGWSFDEFADSPVGHAIMSSVMGPVFAVTYIWGLVDGSHHSGSGNNSMPAPVDRNEINQAYYKSEAEKTQIALQRSATDMEVMMGLDTTTWGYTNAYWQRSVEMVTATRWTADGTFDAHTALSDAQVYSNISNLFYSWQAVGDAAFYTEVNNRALWDSTSYDVQIAFNVGSSSTGAIHPDYSAFCTPTSAANMVYIDTSYPSDVCEETSAIIYVIGGNGSLTASDGTVYALSQGRNAIKDVPSGIYSLGTGCSYAGSFVPVAGGVNLTGAVVLVDSGSFVVALPDNGSFSIIDQNGAMSPADEICYLITYGENDTQIKVPLSGTIPVWDSMISGFEKTVSRCAAIGSNAWDLYTTMGEASQAISVSTLIPDIQNTTLSKSQIYALSVLTMIEMSDYYERNSGKLDVTQLSASAESLELVCHGDIVDSWGNTVASNVIFTPFNYVRDQRLTTRGTVSWDQPGMAIVWAQTNYDTWNGEAVPAEMKMVTLGDGCKLIIDKLVYNDVPVDSIVLEIKQIEKILTNVYKPHSEPDPTPEFADWTIYAQIAFAAIGVTLLLVGFRFRSIPFMLIGIVIGVVGWIYAGEIANLLYRWFGVGK